MAGSIGQPTIGILPWMATKTNTNFSTRTNASDLLGMGQLESSAAQNDLFTYDVWLDSGTWKVCVIADEGPNDGILSLTGLNGDTQTFDFYAAGSAPNKYKEVTGLTVTAGLKTLQFQVASKNASSSSYDMDINSIALIKTAGAHSTPAGSDTPGTFWNYLWWMGVKSEVSFASRDQNSADLGGGSARWNTQNSGPTVDIWLEAGTYTCQMIGHTESDKGISSVRLDGVEQGTMDWYSASLARNVVKTITGISVATAGVKAFSTIGATKNASSSGYDQRLQSVAWIKTA